MGGWTKHTVHLQSNCHFEIESEALVGRIPEVQIDNNVLDYQPEAAAAI